MINIEIPEKWYVRVTDNFKDTPELSEWRKYYPWLNEGYINFNQTWDDYLPRPDLVEISYKDFILGVYKKLPHSWYIKYTGAPEFKKVIDYLNTARECDFYAGNSIGSYYGIKKNGKTYCSLTKNAFGETAIELTIEEFNYLLHSQENKMEKTYKFTRKIAKKIYDIACPEWQEQIKLITYDVLGDFNEEGEIPHSRVQEMFNAATTRNGVDQYKELEKLFPDFSKDRINLEKLKVGQIVKVNGEPFYSAFKNEHYMLKAANGLIDLNDPNNTWSNPDFYTVKGEIIESGHTVFITAK